MIKKDNIKDIVLMNSDLSLAEWEVSISYFLEQEIGERKLRKPKYYIEKLFEIGNVLKEEMKKGERVRKKLLESM